MRKGSLRLRSVIDLLGKRYGPAAPPPTTDPFELILWENVVYLASPKHRREAFERLRSTVGTSPTAILSASPSALERVTAGGILKATFAAKLRDCASIAIKEFGGDLGEAIGGSMEAAKRVLRSFPGIGAPGAEKILLFTGRAALLAPESNGLRVLVRLGLLRDGESYSRTYAASQQVGEALSADACVLKEAHLLLQQHGQTLCKRGAPHCFECPLEPECAYARATRGAPKKRSQPAAARRTAAGKEVKGRAKAANRIPS